MNRNSEIRTANSRALSKLKFLRISEITFIHDFDEYNNIFLNHNYEIILLVTNYVKTYFVMAEKINFPVFEKFFQCSIR